MMERSESPRDLIWIASTLRDVKEFPDHVRHVVGFALFQAQCGGKHLHAKPLKLKGGGVLEVVEDFDGDTYRVVYTVRFDEVLYVLHAFQKKAKQGIRTPKHEMDVVAARLRLAENLHHERERQQEGK